mmetsp:Transcript_27917/g.20912  ORF Transcript_27917/g.20912 Transcript_27917/m.20912 type:complete len:102 (-) Transcript_27917:155-460(-)
MIEGQGQVEAPRSVMEFEAYVTCSYCNPGEVCKHRYFEKLFKKFTQLPTYCNINAYSEGSQLLRTSDTIKIYFPPSLDLSMQLDPYSFMYIFDPNTDDYSA